MSPQEELGQVQAKTKLLKKLNAYVTKEGFQHLRMEDIAKRMDVSRATMYKHFSSKEDVIEGVEKLYEDYIAQLVLQPAERDPSSFGERFQKLFEQSVQLVGNITDIFLKDLQAAFPVLHERLMEALRRRDREAAAFYREGMELGLFNQVNEKLIVTQDNLLLREIVDVKFLMLNQVTLEQMLRDYYTFKKVQVIRADQMSIVDDTKILPVIQYIVKKFSQSL
ncbi:TetR/AcrR family transcriptional regulator [Cohnella zeiphila]|uniref:TetR/AcrR family transcriptional regulator n=1 Tax=Cohnella zeiphila TaxID=2761120 RepID=A0A7X0SSA5_9BACL|nr:TetR/AcrR family transcriptional regulator [Cohnella zeiphila]MBB6734189.1 TetR/AcrR family transcriptional regulator [Cohnella zeiphila]